MKKDNIFTKIINKESNTEIIYQDKLVTAFNDCNPKAPVHMLIIPNTYISGLNSIYDKHEKILGRLIIVASRLAKQYKISKSGYRLIINCNKHGGQQIRYLHLHVLGGVQLKDIN